MMLQLLALLQEGTQAPPAAQPSWLSNPLVSLIPVGVLFFFMMVLPERKKQKQRQAMLDGLKKGDRVMTTSGMFATVVSSTSDTVVLQVAENVRMRFTRTAIQTVEPDKDPADEKVAEPSKA